MARCGDRLRSFVASRARINRTLVIALLLVAVAPSRSQARATHLPRPPIRARGRQRRPDRFGVVLPSQRVPRPISRGTKGGGPIVVPQITIPMVDAPVNNNRGLVDDRPRQQRQAAPERSSAQPVSSAAEVVPNPLLRPFSRAVRTWRPVFVTPPR